MREFAAGAATGLFVVAVGVALIGTKDLVPQPNVAAAPPAPADSTLSPADLRALVYAGDRAGVAAALANLPVSTREDQNRQRDLFSVFSEAHPKVIAFAKDWAEAEPQNPAALAARGWSLQAQGWLFRGEGYAYAVHPQAMQAFRAAHSEGLRLMQQAVALDPRLITASDGILKMSYTVGRSDLIAPEVARIMDILPNRWTMTLSAYGNAPQWGGDPRGIDLLCRAHAAKVKDRPGYDATVCQIDGLLNSGTAGYADVEAAFPEAMDNPLVQEWRDRDADVQGQTPAEKLAHLDKLKMQRPLNVLEANIYDQMSAQVASLTGEVRPKELPAAVARKVAAARAYADRNPGNWKAAARLRAAQMDDKELSGHDFDAAEFPARAKASLQINPFSPGAWAEIGHAKLLGSSVEVDGVRASEPYFINAAVYSNHASENVRMLGGIKMSLVFRAMANGQTPADPQAWQADILCPMVRQLRLLQAVCAAEGTEFAECSGLAWDAEVVDGQIAEITSAGLCKAEADMPVEDLPYSPVQVDLTLN